MADNAEKPKTNEAEPPLPPTERGPILPEKSAITQETTERLNALKSAVESKEKNETAKNTAVSRAFEVFLENGTSTQNGKFEVMLTKEAIQQMIDAIGINNIAIIANAINDDVMKNRLNELAKEVTPSKEGGTGNSFLDQANVMIDFLSGAKKPETPGEKKIAEGMKAVEPLLKKLENIGITREYIVDAFTTLMANLFASIGTFIPAAREAAIALHSTMIEKSIASLPDGDEKEKILAASKTSAGKKNLGKALFVWVQGGSKPDQKPDARAYLGKANVEVVEKKDEKELNKNIVGNEAKELLVAENGDKKIISSMKDGVLELKIGDHKMELKEVAGKKITKVTLIQPTREKSGCMTIALSDGSEIRVGGDAVLEVLQNKDKKVLVAKNSADESIEIKLS